jgi:hypothetical protein
MVKKYGMIVDACPYRVIYWNEEKNIPPKVHLLPLPAG